MDPATLSMILNLLAKNRQTAGDFALRLKTTLSGFKAQGNCISQVPD